MPDDGPDLGYCEECGAFGEIVYVPAPGPTRAEEYNEATYCKLHEPLVMDAEAFDLAFEKAGIDGPRRHRPREGILGILSFSKRHRTQAEKELKELEALNNARRSRALLSTLRTI